MLAQTPFNSIANFTPELKLAISTLQGFWKLLRELQIYIE
jgi:hypothetical protein